MLLSLLSNSVNSAFGRLRYRDIEIIDTTH